MAEMKIIRSETRLVVVNATEWEALKEENERLRAENESVCAEKAALEERLKERKDAPVTSGTRKTGIRKRVKAFWKKIRGVVSKAETDGWEVCEEATWPATNSIWDDSVGQSWDDTTLYPNQSPATTAFAWPDVNKCHDCQDLEVKHQDETDASLRARSRLNDVGFYDKPESRCTVPVKRQQALMSKTLRQSQSAVYRAAGAHWPAIQRQWYYDGPPMVRFGFGELTPVFGRPDGDVQANGMCGRPSNVIVNHIYGVIDLRNATCHFEPLETRRIDSLLQRAQALAVILQDETAAFKIRRWRDELQATATKTYEDIKARVGMAALPFARPWVPHIQRLFYDMVFESSSTDSQTKPPYPVEVVQAAKDWKMKYTSPGELDPGYVAKVARAKKAFATGLRSHDRSSASVNNSTTAAGSDSNVGTKQPRPGPVLDGSFSTADAGWALETVLFADTRKRGLEGDDEDEYCQVLEIEQQ